MTYRPNTETENIVRENNFSCALQLMYYKFMSYIAGKELMIRVAQWLSALLHLVGQRFDLVSNQLFKFLNITILLSTARVLVDQS